MPLYEKGERERRIGSVEDVPVSLHWELTEQLEEGSSTVYIQLYVELKIGG